MMEPQARELIENYLEGYNLFDVAAMLSCLHPAVVFENITDGNVMLRTDGKASFEAQATQALGFFMERNQHIKSFHFEADQAEVGIEYFAITAIDWPNGIKAGTILQLTSQSIFTFRDGLIATIQDIS